MVNIFYILQNVFLVIIFIIIIISFSCFEDVEKLFQIMFSQSGQFFDYLLYKIIDFARRFGRKNIIKLLSTHLGDKVEKALKIETKK